MFTDVEIAILTIQSLFCMWKGGCESFETFISALKVSYKVQCIIVRSIKFQQSALLSMRLCCSDSIPQQTAKCVKYHTAVHVYYKMRSNNVKLGIVICNSAFMLVPKISYRICWPMLKKTSAIGSVHTSHIGQPLETISIICRFIGNKTPSFGLLGLFCLQGCKISLSIINLISP